ncbi:hypothetical protein BGX29_002527 [Mortierella sp. GBA35]|nr:hypothetical protein BGX29_002527 [Mortierella sp. GBA35]
MACSTCLNKGDESLNASCAGLSGLTQPPNLCLCAIASSLAWVNDCAKPEVCGPAMTQALIQSYAGLKSQVCSGGASGTGNSANSMVSCSKATAAGMTVAAVAVLGTLL